jgi:hypothetical protein
MGVQLIHIGKCGGSTVASLLDKHNIRTRHVHIKKPVFNPRDKYLIVIRNPIDRFISAFNWRYKLVVLDETQKNRFPGERDILTKYATVNNLAENIAAFDVNKTYIHHIREDISYYLSDFLQKCKKENILGVVTQENLNHDMEQILKEISERDDIGVADLFGVFINGFNDGQQEYSFNVTASNGQLDLIFIDSFHEPSTKSILESRQNFSSHRFKSFNWKIHNGLRRLS